MGDPSSSSNSRSANVAKMLIDFDEYKKLLDMKQHFETQEAKLKQQLADSVKTQHGAGNADSNLFNVKETEIKEKTDLDSEPPLKKPT